MKHENLRSVAHNLVDSFASGHSAIFGCYGLSIFEDLSLWESSKIEIDFVNARIIGGTSSHWLQDCVANFETTLPIFFRKHDLEVSSFKVLSAKFWLNTAHQSFVIQNRRVEVRIEDLDGRSSIDLYAGLPLSRLKVIYAEGRDRTVRKRTHTIAGFT